MGSTVEKVHIHVYIDPLYARWAKVCTNWDYVQQLHTCTSTIYNVRVRVYLHKHLEYLIVHAYAGHRYAMCIDNLCEYTIHNCAYTLTIHGYVCIHLQYTGIQVRILL